MCRLNRYIHIHTSRKTDSKKNTADRLQLNSHTTFNFTGTRSVSYILSDEALYFGDKETEPMCLIFWWYILDARAWSMVYWHCSIVLATTAGWQFTPSTKKTQTHMDETLLAMNISEPCWIHMYAFQLLALKNLKPFAILFPKCLIC